MSSIPNNYYRTSIKALVLNEENKFLLIKERDGRWELPGGGIDHGESPEVCIRREIKEEMGLNITYVSKQPSYFYTDKNLKYEYISNVLYEVKLAHLNFTSSNECTEVRFFTKEEALKENLFPHVKLFLSVFDTKNHKPKTNIT